MLFKCNPYDGTFLSCSALYRGDFVPTSVMSSIGKIKNVKKFNFIDYVENNFKIYFNFDIPPMVIPGGELAKSQREACMVANNTAIIKSMNKIVQKFDQLYGKQEYVNLYVDEGMEKTEFIDARENLASLEQEIDDLEE